MSQSRARKIAIIGLVAAMFLALATAVAGSSNAVCAACHTPQGEAVASGAHAALACYDCHLTGGAWGLPERKAAELFRMYPNRLLGGGPRGPVRETARATCLECHADVLEAEIEAGGLHIVHDACAEGASCDPCHARTGHPEAGRRSGQPVMEECVACHSRVEATIACDACHDGRIERERSAGPWQVTHGANWRQTHGMGDLDSCAACHAPDDCVVCHGVPMPHPTTFGAQHGTAAIDAPKSCPTCHKDTRLCDSCHGISMPHPEGFLEEHSSISDGVDDPVCARCHTRVDCVECHTNHVHPGGAVPLEPVEGR